MKNLLISTLLTFFSCFASCNESTTIFSWVDSEGTKHFTDERPDISHLQSAKDFSVQKLENQETVSAVVNMPIAEQTSLDTEQNMSDNIKSEKAETKRSSQMQVASPSHENPPVINGIVAYKEEQDEITGE